MNLVVESKEDEVGHREKRSQSWYFKAKRWIL